MTIECPKCLLMFDVHDTYFACPNCDTELILTITVKENEEENGNMERT